MAFQQRRVTAYLTELAHHVELQQRDGDQSIEVTLLVDGAVVTGCLAPQERFATWSESTRPKRDGEALRNPDPNAETTPFTTQQAADYRVRVRPDTNKMPDTLCLRDAYVISAASTRRFPFFLVTLEDVTGFSFGYRPAVGST